MAAIAGPKLEVPPAISDMFEMTYGSDGQLVSLNLRLPWATFFNSAQQTIYNVSRSGPTASRPTSSLPGRFVGMPYFDTTLGKPIFLKTASSNAWVLADGTAA